MLVILACFSLGMDTRRATQARYSPPCPTSGNATHMSHWDFGAAESEMQPPVGRRAAQPLEVIAGPLYRRGAEEWTRANRQKTLEEETLATWTDWRIIFMPPSIALEFDGRADASSGRLARLSRPAPCAFTRPTTGSSPWNSTKSERRFPGHSSPAPIL